MEAKLSDGHIDQFEVKISAGLKASELGADGLSLQALGSRSLSNVTERTWNVRIKGDLPISLDTAIAGANLSQSLGIDYTRSGVIGELPDLSLALIAPALPTLRFGGLSGISIAELNGIDTSDLLAMLDQLRAWFNSLGASVGHAGEGSPLQLNWPDINLPQLGDLRLPDFGDFLQLGNWLELPDLPQFTGTFNLPSWQAITNLIPGFTLGATSFDPLNKTLTYAINLDQELGKWATRLQIGGVANNTAPQRLSDATAVADLNGGAGIADLTNALASLRVSLRNGTSFDVALTGAATLGQIISRIEQASRTVPLDASTKRVTVRIGPDADRLVIEDLTNAAAGAATSPSFKIVALNGLRTGAGLSGLGLVGEDVDGDRIVVGANLNGSSGVAVEAVARLKGSFNIGVDFSALGGAFSLTKLNVNVARTGDFDGDGKSDILWRNTVDGTNKIWRSANKVTTQAVATQSNQNWQIAGVGDFQGDGKADILWRNFATGQNYLFNSGNAATGASLTTLSTAWSLAGVGDFDGDGKSDIFWRNTADGSNTIWRSGNSATTQTVASQPDRAWQVVGIGDFQGDGKSDVLWRNTNTGANVIWKSGNNATPQTVATQSDQSWQVTGIGDFQGDGKADILWRNFATGQNYLFNSGDSATGSSLSTQSTTWVVAGVGDFDGDRKSDILWRNSATGANTVWKSGLSASPLAVADMAASADTTFAQLNGGAGVVADRNGTEPDIRVSFRNGQSIDIDLSGLDTVQQLVGRLEAQTRVSGTSWLDAGLSLTELVPESLASAQWNGLAESTRAMKGETSRIWLRDLTSGTSTFSVESINGSLRGAAYIGLGLTGIDNDAEAGRGDGIIMGAALHGDSMESHVFLSNVSPLTASVQLNVPDIDVRLAVAGFGVGIQNGSGRLRGELTLQLRDPGSAVSLFSTNAQGINTYVVRAGSTTDGRITLGEIVGALGDNQNLMKYDDGTTSRLRRLVGDLVLKGSAILELPIVISAAGFSSSGSNPGISVNWSDLSKRETLRIETRGLNLIEGIRQFAFSELVRNLRDVQQTLAQLEAGALFQQELPIVGKSLKEIVGLSVRFGQFVDELEKNPAETVDQWQAAIKKALIAVNALRSPTDTGSDATYVQSPSQSVFNLALSFENKGSVKTPLDLALGDLGALAKISGVNGNLISASGEMTLAWLGALDLNLQIDISNPLSPVVFIRDNSKARFGLGLDEGRFTADGQGNLTLVNGINANAGMGPLGLFISQGTVRLNDGARIIGVDPSDARKSKVLYDNLAEWTVDVRDETGPGSDGRYRLFGEFGSSLLDMTQAGQIDVVLPIKFPSINTPLDANVPNFALHVHDLSRLTSLGALKALATSSDVNNQVLIPDFSLAAAGLGALTGDLSKIWSGIGEGWSSAFDTLDRLLSEGAFDVPLPLIGNKLAESVRFVRDLRDALAPVLGGTVGARTQEILRQKVIEALRPWIRDHNGNGILDGDLDGDGRRGANEDFVMLATADRIEFDMELFGAQVLADSSIGFDLGLPGLGLDIDGNVRLDLGFSWQFGFGISKTDGFYLKLPNTINNDLQIDLTATLPGFAATGTLGFLRVQAKDDASQPTTLSGRFTVDLKDPSADQRLTVDDLRSGASIGQFFDARFQGAAKVNLDLEASFQGSRSFPRVRADLGVTWSFDSASTQSSFFGNKPVVTFDNVEFNAGDFFNGFFGPLVKDVKRILDPIKPAIDFLTSPVPGISTLLGRPVTMLDVAEALGAPNIQSVRGFIEQIRYLSDLANSIASVSDGAWIKVGNINIGGQAGTTDVRKVVAPGATLNATSIARSSAEVQADLESKGAGSLINNASSTKGGFAFPLFSNPASLFGLLLGQDLTLVTYTTPVFSARLPFSTPQFPILPPIIFGNVFGAIGFDAQFSFSYDTLGVRHFGETGDPADLLDGFYVADTVNGVDVVELSVYGEIGLRASLLDSFAPIVRAGASGALRATINFNLNDPDNDGKVRWDELARNLDLGPIYIFDTSGRIDFELRAWFWAGVDLGFFGKVTIAEASWGQTINILNYTLPRPNNSIRLATLESNGTLNLNIGARAGLRGNGNTSDGDESFRLLAGGTADSVVVDAFGLRQTYSGVKRIVGDAGAGNDTIQVGAGLTLESILIRGGAGNDVLSSESAAGVQFYGDAGADRLIGGSGADLLDGGDGDDWLLGNDGDDTIVGGLGNDQAQGGRGNDLIWGLDFARDALALAPGQSDNDVLIGDNGADTIQGGAGADSINGGAGADVVFGGTGDDVIDGGFDNDTLHGEAGNDTVRGGDGADAIYGGAGADLLLGERGADSLFGGDGDDILWGGQGNDVVDGGADNDLIFGGDDRRGTIGGALTSWGSDVLIGGMGADTIYAGSGVLANDVAEGSVIHGDRPGDDGLGGADRIFGSNGSDTILSGGDRDTVNAYDGDDRIEGGGGNDIVFAGSGNDIVIGGSGNDSLYGESGMDVIWGGAAQIDLGSVISNRGTAQSALNVAVLGLPLYMAQASDMAQFLVPRIVPLALNNRSAEVAEDDGDDLILGGADRDWLFGGAGNDAIDAGTGEDYVDGGLGDDTLAGGDGADVIRGGTGDDLLRGNEGADLLYGDAGRDTLYGDSTVAIVVGASINDGQRQRLYGGDGDDYLYAWSGTAANLAGAQAEATLLGDALYGDGGRDFLYGGLRQDVLYGGAGNDVLRGDAVMANIELAYDVLRTWGAADLLFGGTGEDVLQGGGGPDTLRGGAGADRLEGQNGADRLYGEGGGDVLVVDIDPLYGAADVDYFDGHGDPATPDDGSDRFLIVGTANADTITIGEIDGTSGQASRLWVRASAVATPVVVDWRDAAGAVPRLDQFHVQGLAGDDTLQFVRKVGEIANVRPVDLSVLNARSREWITVIDGGAGNDLLRGTEGRDYMDGGSGSDEVYGFGADDSLWGDDGSPFGTPNTDIDRLYGGQGSDDLYGGRGRNELFAWSINPYRRDAAGNYVDAQGGKLSNQVDPALRLWDPYARNATGLFVDAGGNPLVDQDDLLLRIWKDGSAGVRGVEDTGINRVLGGEGDDVLYGGSGLDFLYGGGGDNLIITRYGLPLAESDGGGFSDDDAWKTYARSTDRVWYYGGTNANDIIKVDKITESGIFEGRTLITRLSENAGSNFSFDAQIRLSVKGSTGADPRWDSATLIDSAALANSEDVDGVSAKLSSTTVVLDLASRIAAMLPPEDDYLAIIIDALGGNDTIIVGPTVDKTVWIDAGDGDDVVRIESGTAILTDGTENIGLPGKPIRKLATDAFALASPGTTQGTLSANLRLQGLTLSTPEDEDWFVFTLASAPGATASINALSLSALDKLALEIYAAKRNDQGALTAPDATAIGRITQTNSKDISLLLSGLTAGEYLLRVKDDVRTTRYELEFNLNQGQAAQSISLAAPVKSIPADVILGGDGNDVLQGGRGEDWIFGGAGNDVLTGGLDRQAPDFLVGGPGDDTFQIMPDQPFDPDDNAGLTNGPLPPIADPGLKVDDLMRGGPGTDRVLFLGGDMDANQRGINDYAAIRFNTQSQRYEFASRIWDTANQQFMKSGPGAEDFDLGYAFFRTDSIEAIQIDLRAGDDEFHAEGGFFMAGDESPGREWGLEPQAASVGASVLGLTILGGTGNDRLFGGPGNDTIDGGSGFDVIAGGRGNDHLIGNDGDDVIEGDMFPVFVADGNKYILAPDAYEASSQQDRTNNSLSTAHELVLPTNLSGVISVDANFHYGDTQDWYLVRAPLAASALGSADRLALDARSVTVASPGGEPLTLKIYAAKVGVDADGNIARDNTGRITSLSQDISAQLASPQYYLLQVVNGTANAVAPSAFAYRIWFDLNKAPVAIDPSDAANLLDRNAQDPGYVPLLIPVGDIDNDLSVEYATSVFATAAETKFQLVSGQSGPKSWLSSNTIADLEGQQQGRLGMPMLPGVNPYETASLLGSADFDRDGSRELVWVENENFRSSILASKTLTPGDPATSPSAIRQVASSPSTYVTAALPGDLNLDGTSDVVTVVQESGQVVLQVWSGVRVWQGTTAQTLPLATLTLATNTSVLSPGDAFRSTARVIAAGDLNGDGRGDVVVTLPGLSVFLKASTDWGTLTGSALRASVVLSEMSHGTTKGELFSAGDIDGDGRTDFVFVSGTVGSLSRSWAPLPGSALVMGGNTPLPAVDLSSSLFGAVDVVALGNFIGDAKRDFAIVGRTGSSAPFVADIFDGSSFTAVAPTAAARIWLGLEASSNVGTPTRYLFAQPSISPELANWVLPLGDIDGDLRADLAIATGQGAGIRIFLGKTATPVAASPLRPAEPAPWQLASTWNNAQPAVDASRPWSQSVLEAAPTLYGSGAVNNFEGAVVNGAKTDTPSMIPAQPVGIGDFNGDGHEDFLLPGSGHYEFQVGGQSRIGTPARLVLGSWTDTTGSSLNELGDLLLDPYAHVGVRGGTEVFHLGIAAQKWGNVDGDVGGTSDLVTATMGASQMIRINVVFGGTNTTTGRPDRVDFSFLTDLSWVDPMATEWSSGDWLRNPGVQVSVGDWNGDGFGDIMVKGDVGGSYQGFLRVYSGAAIKAAYDSGVYNPVNFFYDGHYDQQGVYQKSGLFFVTPGFANLLEIGTPNQIDPGKYEVMRFTLDAKFVGDLDGDGREDLVIASPIDMQPFSTEDKPAGANYFFFGRPNAVNTDGTDLGPRGPFSDPSRDFLIAGFGLGGAVQRLGDVNKDGFDDIALVRYAQYKSDAASPSVEIFLGNQDRQAVLVADAGFQWLLPEPAIFGVSTVTSGDFNADGVIDLAIGTPLLHTSFHPGGYPASWGLLSRDMNGRVDVYLGDTARPWWLVGSSDLIGNDHTPDVTLRGQADELLGVLWSGPSQDVDGDGIDDLLIGRPATDRVDPEFIEDTGGFTMLRGWAQAKPTISVPLGRPLTALLAANGVEVALEFPGGAMQESWFRFSTDGDGASRDGFVADSAAGGPALQITIVRLVSPEATSGDVLSRGRFASLSGLPAGHYALKVAPAIATNSAFSATMYANLPESGRNNASLSDADWIEGGNGNDYLSGGDGIDRLYGGAGSDRFNVANPANTVEAVAGFEVRDRSSEDTGKLFKGNVQLLADVAANTSFVVDPVIQIPSKALASLARLSAGKSPTAQLHMSDVLAITALDLSGSGPIGLAGLEHFASLRSLTINGRGLTGYTWQDARGLTKSFNDLAYLKHLDLGNNALTTIDSRFLPVRLETLVLRNNRIASLSEITQAWAVDNEMGSASYSESGGVWLLGKEHPAIGGDYRFTDGSSQGAAAVWSLPELTKGEYLLSVTWPETRFNSSLPPGESFAQTFTVQQGGTTLLSGSVNQTALIAGNDRPWAYVGAFNLPDDVITGELTVRLSDAATLLGDAVKVEKVSGDAARPAFSRLYALDVSLNPISRSESEAQAPDLIRLLETNANGRSASLVLPIITAPSLAAPGFVELSGAYEGNLTDLYFFETGGVTVLPVAGSPTTLTRHGVIDKVTNGISVDHVEFDVVLAGDVTIDLRSARLDRGPYIADARLRLFGGAAPNSSLTGELYDGLRALDDGVGLDPSAVVTLEAGRYSLEISSFRPSSFTPSEAIRGFNGELLPNGTEFEVRDVPIQPPLGAYTLTISGPVQSVNAKTSTGAPLPYTVASRSQSVAWDNLGGLRILHPRGGGGIGEIVLQTSHDGYTVQESIRTIDMEDASEDHSIVYGTIFNDANLDGKRGGNEPPLEGIWVGIDTNANGDLSDEPIRVGAWTDYLGRYAIDLTPLAAAGQPWSIAGAGDFDGSGTADVLWRNASTGASMIWYSANHNGAYMQPATLDQDWSVAAIADFNGDGRSDVLWRNGATGDNQIWSSADPNDVVVVTSLGGGNSGWRVAGSGDFNGDARADILWRNAVSGDNLIWGGGSSASPIAVAHLNNVNWIVAGIGDFDGNQGSDILWIDPSTGSTAIWRDANSQTQQMVDSIPDANWAVVGIGDFNGDSYSDILWRNSATGVNTIWRNANSASGQAVTTMADQTWQVATVGDFNQNGLSDIFWANSESGANTIWDGGASNASRAVATPSALFNARVVAQDPLWRALPGTTTTLADSYGQLNFHDVIGPRDIGLADWGLPARMTVDAGAEFRLAAPQALSIAGVRQDALNYGWYLYRDYGNPVSDSEPLFVAQGNTVDLTLYATESYYRDYQLVVAAFAQGSDPATRTIADALRRTSIHITAEHSYSLPVVELPVISVSEGDVHKIDLSQYFTHFSFSLDDILQGPRWTVRYSSMDGSTQLGSAIGSGWMADIGRLASGSYMYQVEGRIRVMSGQDQIAWQDLHVTGEITVDNRAPNVWFAAPANVEEGVVVNLTPVVSDPGGEQLTYSWQVTRNEQLFASGNTEAITFTPSDQGSYVISYSASDSPREGRNGLTTTAVRNLTVTNVAPTITQVQVQGDIEGQPIDIGVAFLEPASEDTLRFAWRVLDAQGTQVNSSITTQPLLRFVPARQGNFTVEVVATDKDGASSARLSRVFGVKDGPPVLQTNLADAQALEGQPLSFQASASDSGPVTYAWTARLGTALVATGTGTSFSFTPPNQGAYTVAVVATDTSPQSVTRSANVTVSNRPPAVAGIARMNAVGAVAVPAGGAPLQLAEGQAVILRADATDVAADVLSYTWTLLDHREVELAASQAGSTWRIPDRLPDSPAGSPLQAGSYVIRLSVSDADGGRTTVTRSLVMTNVAPVIVTAPVNVARWVLGDAPLTGSFEVQSNAGISDTLRAEVDFGDGTVDTIALQPVAGTAGRYRGSYSHGYTARSSSPLGWQATLNVFDEEGVVSSAFRVVVVDGPRFTRTGGVQLSNLSEGVAGSWSSYQIALDAAPASDVRVDILTDAQLDLWDRDPTTAGRQSVSSISFTAGNWQTARTIYVTARDDARDEPALVSSVIRHRVVTTDARILFQLEKAGVVLADLRVDTVDNDIAGVLVTAVGPLQTTESGGTAQFDLRLSSQPMDDVTVNFHSSNSAEGRLSKTAVRFTSQTWNTNQRIVVTGVGDNGATNTNDAYQIVFGSPVGDVQYASLPAPAPLGLTNLNVGATAAISVLVAASQTPTAVALPDNSPGPVLQAVIAPAPIVLPTPVVTTTIASRYISTAQSSVVIDLSTSLGGSSANPLLGSATQRRWLATSLTTSEDQATANGVSPATRGSSPELTVTPRLDRLARALTGLA
jgi:Ca2+-binding RTX toxin-like protein